MMLQMRWRFGVLCVVLGCQPQPVQDPTDDDHSNDNGANDEDGDDWTGPPPAWAECSVPSDCVLAAAGCCDPCDVPTLDDVDAVHRDRLDDHLADVCPGGPSPCPACPIAENAALVATCEGGYCEAVDLRDHPVNTCVDDVHCRVRVRDCCECGADIRLGNLVALPIGAEEDYVAMVCDPQWSCPECEPVYPNDVHARCLEGACQLSVE